MIPEVRVRYDQIRNGKIPQGYKQTAVGIVPQEWNEFSLGEVYTERKQAGDPSLPVLSVSIHSGVSEGELDEESLGKKVKRIEDKTQYQTALEGDLVFNMMRAWQGAIGVVRNRGLVSPAYIVAKPGNQVYPPFMDYYMQTPRMINLIQRMSYGVTDFRLRLYWDSFEQIPCVLPPLQEQKRIVEILKAHDTLIDLCRQKIEHLRQMKKVFLKKSFPQKDCNMPEIRFPGFAAPWEQRRLGDNFSFLQNNTLSRADLDDDSGEAKNVHYGDILTELGDVLDISRTQLPYISSASITERYKGSLLHDGDVVMADTAEDETAGKCTEVMNADGCPVLAGLHTIPMRPNRKYAAGYLGYYMNSPAYHNQLLPLMQGIKVTSVSKSAILNTLIMSPSDFTEQAAIGRFFIKIDNLINLHQRELEAEQQKKKALMQLLLTGLVRIPD